MATISIAGTVTGGKEGQAVTVKSFPSHTGGDPLVVAQFSVADLAYVPTRPGEEKVGQFYKIEVKGKSAEICADRLSRGDQVAVNGQLIQRKYQDQTYYDVKNAQVTFLGGPKQQDENQEGFRPRSRKTTRDFPDEIPF